MPSRVISSVERRARVALCGLLLLASSPAWSRSAIETLDYTTPRAFGWRIGDRFERDILLRLHAPYRLVPDSLPPAGRHTHWLALTRPPVEERNTGGITEYRVRLRYQIVNVTPDVPDVTLPALTLRMEGAGETQQALIRASRLRITTITDFTGSDLRPAQPPAPLPVRSGNLIAWSTLFGASLLGFAWLRWGNALVGDARPFARLQRQLARAPQATWTDEAYGDALRAVHRAFDTTAGRTLFGESLDGFLTEAPRFAALGADIRDFFRRSNAHFYRHGDAVPAYTHAELLRLVAACAERERGLS